LRREGEILDTVRVVAILAGVVLTAAAVVGGHGAAGAQGDDAACAAAFEKGQELQQAGRLRAAKERLLSCAAAGCPDFIRAPCVAVLDEVEGDLPSLVIVVRDAAGRDVPGARVRLDGVVVAERSAGNAVSVDPGEHAIVVEPPRGAPLRRTIVVHAGERNRRVELTLGRRASKVAKEPRPLPEPRPAAEPASFAPAAIAFGLGAAAIVVSAITGGLALAEQSELDEVCPTPTTCPVDRSDQIDRAQAEATASTVALVIGGVGIGLGVVLLLTGPLSAEAGPARSAVVLPSYFGLAGSL
jgi:hypothetical protein